MGTKLAGENTCVHGTRTAEGKKGKVAGVQAFFNSGFTNNVSHLELSDLGNPCCSFVKAKAKLIGNCLHGSNGLVFIKNNLSAQEVIGVDVAKYQVGIGDGWSRITFSVACWAWIRSRRLRANSKGLGESIHHGKGTTA